MSLENYEANYNARRIKKLNAPKDVHIPGKIEAKTMRKIMSQTGLSLEEIKSHKKYRIELANTQKLNKTKKDNKTDKDKAIARVLKQITKELKLPKEHPVVIERFKADWQKYYGKINW